MKTLRDYINLINEKSLVAENVVDSSGNPVRDSSGKPVQSGTPAPAADAVAAAKAKLTPSQLKWLGGANPTDPAIMARMPKPKAGEQVPGAAPATPAAAPAAAGKPEEAPEKAMGAGSTPPPAQAGQPAAAPSGPPPGSVDDEGNLMPGFTKDENGNVVSAGDANFVEPATQALAQQGRQAAKEKEIAANQDAEDQAMGQAMTANAQQAQLAASSAGTGVGNPGEEAAAQADFLRRQAATNAQTAADTAATAQRAATQAANGVNAQGQNVSIANADGSKTNPEDGSVTPAPAQAAAPAAPAQAGQPANRDSMTFGQAFADAKAKGEKQFTWKGKPYAVQMAQTKPAQNAGAGRGGQGGPTAAQMAQANAAKPGQAGTPGTFAADTAARKKANNPMNIQKPATTQKESREPNDSKFIAELDAMRRIAGLR